jgi:molybdate transport system substrate-binding protein
MAGFGLLVVLVLSSAIGCDRADSGQDAAPEDSRRLMVFAASSLTEAFGDMAESFERAHPGVEVSLYFAGSQTLRTQILNGAPADVFAPAGRKYMRSLGERNLVGPARVFARNELVIVTPADNPAGIASVRELPQAERLVVGARAAPVGRYAGEFLERAGREFGGGFRQKVERDIVSREVNARLVLAKVAIGEADAGIVYRTDAAARGDKVWTVEIPKNLNMLAAYPIAAVARTPRAELAEKWVKFVLSDEGQEILAEHGFITVEPARSQ